MLSDAVDRRRPGSHTGDAPGCFVLVVGPSGAGKDTLLAGGRARLAGEPRYRFVRRAITRPPSASEDNEHLSEAQFDEAVTQGRFVLTWLAHGLRYGVPSSALDDLRKERIVVCNGSRGAVGAALAVFASLRVVLVTAPREVRLQRLTSRRREADLGGRLDRALDVDISQCADLVIDNSGTVENGVETLVTYLRSLG